MSIKISCTETMLKFPRLDFFFFLTFGLDRKYMCKLGLHVPLCKYFLIINDLYNGVKIVNLPLVVVEI